MGSWEVLGRITNLIRTYLFNPISRQSGIVAFARFNFLKFKTAYKEFWIQKIYFPNHEISFCHTQNRSARRRDWCWWRSHKHSLHASTTQSSTRTRRPLCRFWLMGWLLPVLGRPTILVGRELNKWRCIPTNATCSAVDFMHSALISSKQNTCVKSISINACYNASNLLLMAPTRKTRHLPWISRYSAFPSDKHKCGSMGFVRELIGVQVM